MSFYGIDEFQKLIEDGNQGFFHGKKIPFDEEIKKPKLFRSESIKQDQPKSKQNLSIIFDYDVDEVKNLLDLSKNI